MIAGWKYNHSMCLGSHDCICPVAGRQNVVDLVDDGVQVNHAKFDDILTKVK